MILSTMVGVWQGYRALNIALRIGKIIVAFKNYTSLFFKNPDVQVKCDKIIYAERLPKDIINIIYNELTSGTYEFKDKVEKKAHQLIFTPTPSNINFSIKFDPHGIDYGMGTEQSLILSTNTYIINPFRGMMNGLKKMKKDFYEFSDLISRQIQTKESAREIITLEIELEKFKDDPQVIKFKHENCSIVCQGTQIQVKNLHGTDYTTIICPILIRWFNQIKHPKA